MGAVAIFPMAGGFDGAYYREIIAGDSRRFKRDAFWRLCGYCTGNSPEFSRYRYCSYFVGFRLPCVLAWGDASLAGFLDEHGEKKQGASCWRRHCVVCMYCRLVRAGSQIGLHGPGGFGRFGLEARKRSRLFFGSLCLGAAFVSALMAMGYWFSAFFFCDGRLDFIGAASAGMFSDMASSGSSGGAAGNYLGSANGVTAFFGLLFSTVFACFFPGEFSGASAFGKRYDFGFRFLSGRFYFR